METLKVGIIGTGFSASFHLEALRRTPNVEVIAIAGRTMERAEVVARHFGIRKYYGEAMELIQDAQVDVVHNCTPNHLHFDLNRSAIKAGKHVLSEKPLAMTTKETAELKKLSKQYGVVNGVSFNYRFFPLVNQARQMIREGQVGKVNLVYGGFLQDWLMYHTDYNWRLNKAFSGSTRAIADIGSHWCDLLQYVMGKKIVKVFADFKTIHRVRQKPKQPHPSFPFEEVEWEPKEIDTEDYASVLVHFEDGIQGVFTVSEVSAGRKNKLFFEIAAEKSSLAWNQEHPNQLWVGRRGDANGEIVRDASVLHAVAASMVHYPGGHEEGWSDAVKNQMIEFYDYIHKTKAGKVNETPLFATFQDGHDNMKIIEAIAESNQRQQWVCIK